MDDPYRTARRQAIWLSLLFLVAASFNVHMAREWNGHWYVLLPAFGTLASSLCVFILVFVAFRL